MGASEPRVTAQREGEDGMVAARADASAMTRPSSRLMVERGRPVNVVLMGPPGAGKGTQAGTVARLVDVAHVASGDLLREISKQERRSARQMKAFMDRGELVPDELTMADGDGAAGRAGLRQRLHPGRLPPDGGPGEDAGRAAGPPTAAGSSRVIDLVVPDEVLLARLSGRWLCRDCHASYHVVFSPPTVPGVCDRCGGPLYQRAGRHAGDGAAAAGGVRPRDPAGAGLLPGGRHPGGRARAIERSGR